MKLSDFLQKLEKLISRKQNSSWIENALSPFEILSTAVSQYSQNYQIYREIMGLNTWMF